MSRFISVRGRDLVLNLLYNETRYAFGGGSCWYSRSTDDEKPQEKKIFLLNTDKKYVGTVTVDEAQRLAKKKNLTLVKIADSISVKSRLETYQLTSRTDKSNSREEKTVNIGSKITEHDLGVRIKSMQKWFSKGYVVRATIFPIHLDSAAESIYDTIGKSATESGYEAVQKQLMSEGKMLKFVLQPDKKKAAAASTTTTTSVDTTTSVEKIPKL
ncbi:hypothetical protein CHUAL_006599 [Chamberlinius hualienensis]